MQVSHIIRRPGYDRLSDGEHRCCGRRGLWLTGLLSVILVCAAGIWLRVPLKAKSLRAADITTSLMTESSKNLGVSMGDDNIFRQVSQKWEINKWEINMPQEVLGVSIPWEGTMTTQTTTTSTYTGSSTTRTTTSTTMTTTSSTTGATTTTTTGKDASTDRLVAIMPATTTTTSITTMVTTWTMTRTPMEPRTFRATGNQSVSVVDLGSFAPVNGGQDQGCKKEGDMTAYYSVHTDIPSLNNCTSLCSEVDLCTGVEYLSEENECRIWRHSIDSGVNTSGSTCLRHDPKGFTSLGSMSGSGHACNGLSGASNKDFSTLLDNVSLHECKVHCARKQSCSGIEFQEHEDGTESGLCNVWMHAIISTTPMAGAHCFRYTPPGFHLQDGGVDRACRGRTVAQDGSAPGEIVTPIVESFHDCQVHCTRGSYCRGISFSANGGCQVWMREVETSVEENGSICMTFEPSPSNSLLCVSLVVPWSMEPELLEIQLERRWGIFGCEDFAVYSSPQISLAGGLVETRDLGIDLHCQRGGQFNTFVNTPIFTKFWDRLIRDAEFKSTAWAVKSDPDAVFFPDRLRSIVDEYRDPRHAMFFNNCQLGLHGPLEIMSRASLEQYYGGHHLCAQPPTEDDYLSGCFHRIGVQQVDRWDLLAEKDCWRNSFVKDPQWHLCNDYHAAFHPFKTPESFGYCMSNALSFAAKRALQHGQ